MYRSIEALQFATTATLIALAAAAVLACGSSTPRPTDEAKNGSTSPGDQCLADAHAERHPPASAPERIEVRHILVRHRDLERPEGATRSPAEACLRAVEAISRLESGEEWAKVVQEFSDAKTDDLGRVARDELSPAFANAAFELESGQLSYVVETDRGFHVIWRQ